MRAAWRWQRKRDFAGATAAADAIEKFERTADFKLLKESNIPAQEVLRIARTVVMATRGAG